MRRISWERIVAVLLLLPSVVATAIFIYGFIGFTAFVSLTKWKGLLPNFALVGLRNYRDLFKHPRFQIDMQNMVVFTLVFLGLSLIIGLLLAILLDQQIKGESIFRTIFIYPMAISAIVTGVAWRWLLAPGSPQMGSTGVNRLFEVVGLEFLKSGWYADPKVGIKAVAFAAFWQMSGYVMALYLAGLRGIPDELREAARVDGASEFQVYRHIILPMLWPITLSAVIILGHIALKIYDLVVAMTGEGPGFATDVPAYFMWVTTFQSNRFAQGAGVATILLLMVAVLIIPYLAYTSRKEIET